MEVKIALEVAGGSYPPADGAQMIEVPLEVREPLDQKRHRASASSISRRVRRRNGSKSASFSRMIDVMATADVLVCASRDDPSPLVVFDAMSLRRAIVSTRVGAVPELIADGESGLLVGREDPGALAAALVRLHDDRDLVARLGAQARRRFEEHLTLDRFGAEVLEELRSASIGSLAAPVERRRFPATVPPLL